MGLIRIIATLIIFANTAIFANANNIKYRIADYKLKREIKKDIGGGKEMRKTKRLFKKIEKQIGKK